MMIGRAVFLLAIAAYHYVVAWVILFHPLAANVTALHKFASITPAAIALVLASTLCCAAVVLERYVRQPLTQWVVMSMHVPQQYFLVLTAIGAYEVTVAGAYPDGYVPGGDPHWFIFLDQGPYIIIAIAHLFLILNGYMPLKHLLRREQQKEDDDGHTY